MPLGNSLIRGSQSLFGIKTQLQFGRLYVTNTITTQRGSADRLSIEDGTQGSAFSVSASSYETDRHFFLSHFFRDNYETWLEQRPQIISGVNITRVEVYVLNRSNETATLRQVLAFLDLAEPSRIYRPSNPRIGSGSPEAAAGNESNLLFSSIQSSSTTLRSIAASDQLLSSWGLEKSIDYEKITSARRLGENEYIVHPTLGYIRLSRRLQNDEVLAVSYEYTYNGQRYKVGELTEDYQSISPTQAIFLKMLRPSRINTKIPSWDLMMKNVYTIGTGSLRREGFSLQIQYRDDARGLDNPTLQEGANVQGRPLVELLGLDNLNPNGDPPKDGNFDYLENVTVHSQEGLIIFPVLEPFGRTLESYFDPNTEQDLIEKYVFDSLYRLTENDATNFAELNKYSLTGEYTAGSGGSNSFRLPAFGVVEGSVRVTAGGQQLVEGQDYTVDYNLGRVTITNQSILASGKKIDIAYEKSDFLSTRNRTLIGTRMDYDLSSDLKLGGTLMYLTDQQGSISRYQLGTEPIRNLKYGLDLQYDRESLLLTKALDKLPLISTKAPSSVRMQTEFAQLVPGTSNIVGGDRTFYIDDFESALQPISLGNFRSWRLASTPSVPGDLYDKSSPTEPLGSGYTRAHISWFAVDNDFYLSGSEVDPSKLGPGGTENHYTRRVSPREIFPLRDTNQGVISEQVFNIAYFPRERGAYNYTPLLNEEARFSDPYNKWGGITRNISNEVDFDKINVEYLEFWLMDPFISGENGRILDGVENKNNTTGGKLVFNLGDISEDLIPDRRHSFEQGLPTDGSERGVVETPWGRVTTSPFVTQAFENNPTSRSNQDVGLDGLSNERERSFFQEYLSRLPPTTSSKIEDVSADNFSFYLGDKFDARSASILERYKYFNNSDGNTPLVSGGVSPVGSTFPDNEDLNQDNTISDLEAYYEYNIDLRPGQLQIGENHIVDKVDVGNGVSWYLFRVPVRSADRTYGGISGFKAVKFVRMYLTEFTEPVVIRLVRMQLVGSRWNRYEQSLADKDVVPGIDTDFSISSVGLEENNSSLPGKSPYVLPPGVSRDENDFSFNQQRYNEQSLQLCVEDLKNGDARAAFKVLSESLVNYKRLRMFFHVHGSNLRNEELEAFIRLGADYEQNYYEISVPLKVTPSNVSGSGIERLVWPEENEIDLSLDELYAIKLRRDREKYSTTERYMREVGRYKIYVVGRPRLSRVETAMIGVRNPKSTDNISRSGCVWANELRTTGIDKQQGWATNLRVDTKMADFMDISASTRYSSSGFGDVQDGVQQRSLENNFSYDLSSTLQLGKLVPEKVGINLPMFVSYEENSTTPEYDPLNSDVPLSVSLLSRDKEERDRYEEISTSRTRRRSINFTNVRKQRTRSDAKVRLYDVENFSLTYAYSDRLSRTINIDHEKYVHQYGTISYDFSTSSKYVEPFKSGPSHPYMKWLRDVNVGLFPQGFSFSYNVDRKFQRKQLRNADLTTEGVDPVFEKSYLFNRNYGMQWNLARNLSLQYDAQAVALIDEPDGNITSDHRREIWKKILELGRAKDYSQNTRLEYTLPFDKFPVLDWTTTRFSYGAGYMWKSGSRAQISSLGHTIENSREIGWNLTFDMRKLYGKSSLLSSPKDTTSGFLPYVLGFFTLLQNVDIRFTRRAQTFLPSFLLVPQWLGSNIESSAPGWDFIFGSQDPDIRLRAADRGWLVRNSSLTLPFRQQLTEELSLQAALQPISDLGVQLSANRSSQGGYQEIFRYDDATESYATFTPSRNGSYSVSFVGIGTFFTSDDGFSAFSEFSRNRSTIKARLDEENPTGDYDINAQDVLIPSFIAAYSGRDANSVRLSPFLRVPFPNWQINYQGLNRITALQGIFSSITLNHSYSSSYTTGNFSSSLLYDNLYLGNDLLSYRQSSVVENGRLVPFYIISRTAIVDNFAPLFGISMSFRNNINLSVDLKRARELNLNLSNAQLSEVRSNDIAVDLSYSRDKVRIPLAIFGRNQVLENTFTARLGFTWRSTQEWQRVLDSDALVTGGNTSQQYRGSLDYDLNRFLNLQIYVEYGNDKPRLTNAFPRRRTAVGLRLRLNWSQ